MTASLYAGLSGKDDLTSMGRKKRTIEDRNSDISKDKGKSPLVIAPNEVSSSSTTEKTTTSGFHSPLSTMSSTTSGKNSPYLSAMRSTESSSSSHQTSAINASTKSSSLSMFLPTPLTVLGGLFISQKFNV